MLLSDEIESLCKAFAVEAQSRPEIAAVFPERLIRDEALWNMLFDLVESAIHRSGYVIIRDPRSI